MGDPRRQKKKYVTPKRPFDSDRFEQEFISQGEIERRPVEETLGIAWNIFSMLPKEDMKLIQEEYIKKYLPETS